MSEATSAAILGIWAKLCPPGDRCASWTPMQQMLNAAIRDSMAVESELRELLDQSDKLLAPLCDPLRAKLGLHRWLSQDREEAYSDWLAWILEQLNGKELTALLQVETSDAAKYCRESTVIEVKREKDIRTGRLDLLVSFGQDAILVIEVKVSSAEDADTAKQKGYSEWIKNQRPKHKLRPILIAVSARDEDYEGFAPLTWADLCVGLRRMLPALIARLRLVQSAMIVAFVGAVEMNLLHLSVPEALHGLLLFNMHTCEHLRRSLCREAS